MAFGPPWSSLFQHNKMLFSAVFSQARNPLHLQHHKSAPVKLWGGGGGAQNHIKTILTGEISETSINYNNSLLKTFTQKLS